MRWMGLVVAVLCAAGAARGATLAVRPDPPGPLAFQYTLGSSNPVSCLAAGCADNGVTAAVSVSSPDGTLAQVTAQASLIDPVGFNVQWLSVSPGSRSNVGSTPQNFTVSINSTTAGRLAPNFTYKATLRIASGGAAGSPKTYNVTLSVVGVRNLIRNPPVLGFVTTVGSGAPVQGVSLLTDNGQLYFKTLVSTDNGGNWLSVNPSEGIAPIGINVLVNTAGLTAGTYTGTLVFQSTNPSVNLMTRVGLTLSPPTAQIQPTPPTLSFSYRIGGAAPATQQLTIGSSGQDLNYTLSASPGWLSVTPATGTTPGPHIVRADPTGLGEGTYTGGITVTSAAAVNSPANIPVSFTVTSAPAAGAQVIAQFADGPVPEGGRWKTIYVLVNRDTTEAPFTLRFWGDAGTATALPIAGLGARAEVQGTIPAGGSRTIETDGSSGLLLQGWAELVTTKSVGGLAVFRQQVAGRPDFEASVPLTAAGGAFLLPFDNTQGFDTTAALVNANASQGAAAALAARDENGAALGNDTINVGAHGHGAFLLRDRVAATAGRRGVAAFNGGAEVFGLGLRFNPGGAFTSLTALAVAGAAAASQVMGQIADGPVPEGGRWKSTVIVVNRDTTEAPFTLRFWSDNGTALAMPVGGTNVTQVTGTIPAGGSRTIETDGSSAALMQGWAELASTKALGGLAVFRQQAAGRPDFEAAAPVTTTGGAGFLLPFDNTQGFVTAMTLVNTNANQSIAVAAVFRDETGAVIQIDSISLTPRQHVAFSLADRYGALAGKRGVAEFTSGDAAGLGLRFNPGGSFTSVGILAK